ncbi:MAG: hypothetical protein WC362_07265 [Methanoregula sp.]|jgi:hypothetical protein
MKVVTFLTLITVILLAGIGGTTAYVTPESLVAAGNVYVSNVTYDPGAFFTGDTGTVTVTVTNGNTNQSIVANHATFGDKNFQLTSGTYDTSSTIGPLQTRDYVFSVVSDAMDGTYYPVFSLSLRDADNLYYRGMVRGDNTPLVVTVLSKPDSFTQAKKDTISLQVANPRKNEAKNVILEISGGDGVDLLPSTQYIGKVAAGTSIPVNFSVTPNHETTLDITLKYDNGDNHHSVDLQIPVVFTPDKKKASPVMSNIVVTTESGTIHITGDVTNAGLTVANAVTVTACAPAVPQDPYKAYVIGALKPDDFGSFEVTFSAANSTTIPIQLSYRDTDGNVISSTQNVTVPVFSANTQKTGFPALAVIAVVSVVAIFVGGWFVYLKRYKQ